MVDFAILDVSSLHNTGNRAREMIVAMLDGEVGQREFPSIASSHSRAT